MGERTWLIGLMFKPTGEGPIPVVYSTDESVMSIEEAKNTIRYDSQQKGFVCLAIGVWDSKKEVLMLLPQQEQTLKNQVGKDYNRIKKKEGQIYKRLIEKSQEADRNELVHTFGVWSSLDGERVITDNKKYEI